eukprot:11976048-Prorocentrum_lima.AAC.1
MEANPGKNNRQSGRETQPERTAGTTCEEGTVPRNHKYPEEGTQQTQAHKYPPPTAHTVTTPHPLSKHPLSVMWG